MSGAISPILHYLYDLEGKTLHPLVNRVILDWKTAVAIFWLGLCILSTVSLDSNPISGVQNHTRYPWYHLLCMGICGLLFGFLSWNLSIRCTYFWRVCTSGVCFRYLFSDAVRPHRYTLANVYIMKGLQIFSPQTKFRFPDYKRQYHRNKISYFNYDIYMTISFGVYLVLWLF
jgi:hypothetical protein